MGRAAGNVKRLSHRREPARQPGIGEKNLAAVDLSGVDVRYIPVGRRSDNVGIVAFNVRRYIANKAAYEVFIEIQNFGTERAQRVVRASEDHSEALKAYAEKRPPQWKGV